MEGRRRTLAVLLVLIMVGTSFTSLASYAVGQEIDSDRDGYSDKYERLMGTNPDDPNDYPGSNSTNGPDKPGGPSIIESFQIDVLPSSRIVHEDQPISVAVYVRKDGDLVGQRLVHMMVFQASGQFLDLVAAQKDVLDNGRASFQYSHPTTGVVYFVATMEDNGADLGEHTTIASVVAKKTNMRVGFVNIAVYQRYFATIGADFLHLLPGMMAGLTMNLYELRTSGLSDDVVDKWVDRTTPLPALDDIYAPASGTVHLTGVGPGAFYVQQDVQCEGTSCSYVNILPSIGQYSFHASGYQDSRFVSDVAFVTVHDPIYRDISIFDHYNLFETGQLQVSVKKVSSALDRDEFDRLMTEVDGSMAGFAKAHPDLMAPIVGHADFYFIYMKHSEALVLKHGEMIYNGTGFDTYTFGVPGNYRVVVVDGPIGCPDGIFSDFGMVPSTAFQQNIVVATDFLMTTFPNKLSYFPAEHVMLTTMFTSGDKVVRDMPVALYVDGKYVDQSQIKPGEFVVQHDLGMMAQGGHTVTTFPITSQDSKKVLNAFNAQSFHEPWVGNAGFNVRGIGIYLDLPGKAVKGLPFSFRLVALDAPMQPCTGCAYKAWLVQGEETMQVASGSTDDAGAAAVTFNFPDIYFDAIRIDVTKDGSNSSMVRSLEPRAQLLTGITITNKPLYQAGETVMLRFLIWNQDQVAPGTGDLDVRVRDPEGRELSRQKLALDAFGSAQLQVPLATDQREGDYTVEAWVSGIEDPIIESTFKVEAYTTPTVEVVFENTKDVVDQWTTNFTVPYSVKYMFGKEVTEGGISWEAGFIRKGYKNEHTIIAGEAKVNGTWPMKVKFDLTNMVLPNDQVYVKIDFKDRFGHNATGKLLLGVTEAKTLYNLDVVLDKKEYNPGDPVGIRVSLNKEDRSLGKSTIKPMGGETVVLSVQAPDGTGHTSQVLIGQDGNWTGTLAGLGVDADKFHRTGKLTNITLEADYQHLIFTAKIVNIVFKTVEPVLSTDKDGYAAGQDAVIYVAIRDLVNNAFLSGPYSVKVHRDGDNINVLFSSIGTLDASSMSLVWKVPATLSTGKYVIEAVVGTTHLVKNVQVEDKTPSSLKVSSSENTYRPGDRIELRVDLAKPFTGRLYVDYMAQGRLHGMSLRFDQPTEIAVVDLTAGDWRSPIWASAYFVSSTGGIVTDSVKVDRASVALKVKIDTSKVEYQPGDIMTLTLEVTGADGILVQGAMMALSVIDASIFDLASEFDDGAWMAAFGVPDGMDRGYGLVSDVMSGLDKPLGTYEKVAAFYGLGAYSQNLDTDRDGLSNYREWTLGTALVNPDTDGDGLPDGWEVAHNLDPRDPSDGLSDHDNDGMPNGWEYRHGLDPLDPSDAYSDTDRDGLTAFQDYQYRTDPNNWDTDGDGMPDGWEVKYGLNPMDSADANVVNGDGITNLEKFWMQMMPGRPMDYKLNSTTDSDGDGMPDVWEARYGLDPFNPSDANLDTDMDGWTNVEEYVHGTDPNLPNTDGDCYEWDSLDPNPLWNDCPFEMGGTGGGQGGGQGGGGQQGGGQGSGGTNGGGSGSGSGEGTGSNYSGGGNHGEGLPHIGDHGTGGNGMTNGTSGAGFGGWNGDLNGGTAPPPVVNPFIPHTATSTEIESYHQRKWFTDTACWAPDLLMDNGVLRLSVLLPDNIGRWRIKAAAWTSDLRAGETTIDVNSYKGLFVEAVVPDGIYQDDEVSFKARVYNLDNTPKDVKVILNAGDWLGAFGENERTVRMGANEVKEVPFFVKINGMHEQQLRFGVSDGITTDSVTAKTYINPNGARKTQHFAGNVDSEVKMLVESFPEAIDGSNNATLRMSAGYDGLFLQGAHMLAQYPYDCTEQTMTKLLTNTLVWKYHMAKGDMDATNKEYLTKTIYQSLNRLLTLQHSDGGWGWWVSDTSDAWMTSYVLFGYSVVKDQGFHVDGNSISGGWEFMLKTASDDGNGGVMWAGTSWLRHKDDTMTATVLYSMLASGYPYNLSKVVQHLEASFESGNMKDPYTVTLYGLAREDLGMNVSAVRAWLQDNMVDGDHWANGNSLGGKVETTGWATYFLVKTGTAPKDIRPTLAWISGQRTNGAWSTTSTTIASLFAVTEVMRTAKQPKANVKVMIDGVVVKEFRGLNEANFKAFNSEFDSLDISKYMTPGKPNEVRIVKEGEGDLFYELTDVQYLRTNVKVTFQAGAQGRVGDLIDIWMEVRPDASKNVDLVGLTVGVPEAAGLELLNTRKVVSESSGDGSVRYIHTFAARAQGLYTLAPIVISYQLSAGEVPSGVIRNYFGPVQVLVKVPLSELTKKPGLVEKDLKDLINQTRDSVKDKVQGVRDDVQDKINETKKRIENVTDINKPIIDKTKEKLNNKTGTIIDDCPITKHSSGRSMDLKDSSDVTVEVDASKEEGKVTVVDFVPTELEVISIGNGGNYQDGKITWQVSGGQETKLDYKVKAKEEFNGDLGKAVALGTESIAGVSNAARLVFTTKNFVVVRDVQSSAYAGDMVSVRLTVMTTGTALWYAALEDYAPAGAVIDEDSVAANLNENVLSYKVAGNMATFFIRKAANLTLTYNYVPSLVGTTIAPPARAYPMYDTANTTTSDSYALSVDYGPSQTEGGGGGSGGLHPPAKVFAGPRLSVTPGDIVVGEASPVEKRSTTVDAYVHNDGDLAVQATVTVYDLTQATNEKRLVGYQVALVEPGKSTMVRFNWVPKAGDHSLIVEAQGSGDTVQATKVVTVKEESVSGGIGTVTAGSVANGPALFVILALCMVIAAGIAAAYGKNRADKERKALEEKAAKKVRKQG